MQALLDFRELNRKVRDAIVELRENKPIGTVVLTYGVNNEIVGTIGEQFNEPSYKQVLRVKIGNPDEEDMVLRFIKDFMTDKSNRLSSSETVSDEDIFIDKKDSDEIKIDKIAAALDITGALYIDDIYSVNVYIFTIESDGYYLRTEFETRNDASWVAELILDQFLVLAATENSPFLALDQGVTIYKLLVNRIQVDDVASMILSYLG